MRNFLGVGIMFLKNRTYACVIGEVAMDLAQCFAWQCRDV